MCIRDRSYSALLNKHPNFAWFLSSYIVTCLGEWLTYVASLNMVQHLQQGESGSAGGNHNLAVSLLVVWRILPWMVLPSVGGWLADLPQLDRRRLLIQFNVAAAVVALGLWIAYWHQSLTGLYVGTALQQGIGALYDTVRFALVPQLLLSTRSTTKRKEHERDAQEEDEDCESFNEAMPLSSTSSSEDLAKANTAMGLVYSSITALGACLGGVLAQTLGISSCFAIDAGCYIISAYCLIQIVDAFGGCEENKFDDDDDDLALQEEGEDEEMPTTTFRTTDTETTKRTTMECCGGMDKVLFYLFSSSYGPLVLLAACAGTMIGSADVLYTDFSSSSSGVDGDVHLDNLRLGFLFAGVGVGSVCAPLIVDALWKAHARGELQARQWAASMALVWMGAGYVMVGMSTSYWSKWIWNTLRMSAYSVLWVNATYLIQETMPQHYMGRIMALDSTLCYSTEGLSALAAGFLLDQNSVSPNGLAMVLGWMGIAQGLIWILYTAATYTSGHDRHHQQQRRSNHNHHMGWDPLDKNDYLGDDTDTTLDETESEYDDDSCESDTDLDMLTPTISVDLP